MVNLTRPVGPPTAALILERRFFWEPEHMGVKVREPVRCQDPGLLWSQPGCLQLALSSPVT